MLLHARAEQKRQDRLRSIRGATAAQDSPVNHNRTDGLLVAPTGRVDAGAPQRCAQWVAASGQLTAGHRRPAGAPPACIRPITKTERLAQPSLDLPEEPRPGHLELGDALILPGISDKSGRPRGPVSPLTPDSRPRSWRKDNDQ